MRLTLFLIAVMLAVFYYTHFVADAEKVFDTYGFSGTNLLKRPEVLITSIFLHADATHLLSNIFVFFFFGIALEKEIKALRMLFIFFAGAILGDLMSLIVYPFDAISIGASAGIFAVVGAGILITPFDLSFYPYIIPIPLGFLGVMYAFYNAYGFVTDPFSHISYIGHFGGLFAGLFYGLRREGLNKSVKTIIIILALMIALPIAWILLSKQFT
jgi:membrane associated rhomboid family serine protease